MDRLRAEVERLTSMNVSLAAASERLLERNVDLYERMDGTPQRRPGYWDNPEIPRKC